MKPHEPQAWDPQQYAHNARFVSDLGMPVVELLSPRADERILDLGCGDGALTIKLQQAGCQVVGVDSSPEMIAAARSLGLDARLLDAHALPFEDEFDAVFSNAALHWMNGPADVLKGVWRALKPEGRFVGELGGKGNVAAIVSAMESSLSARGFVFDCPWFFPSAEQYRDLLEQHGFTVQSIKRFPRPTPLPGDIGDWLETFAQPYIGRLPADQRRAFVTEVIQALNPVLCDQNGRWFADYVRLRFFARKNQTTFV
jgi:trans-aconitate methyltransferase